MNQLIVKAYTDTLESYSMSELSKDYPIFRSRRHLKELHMIVKLLPNAGTFLDIGCGSGIIPETLHRLGYRVFAVDFSDTGGQMALKRLVALGISGHFCQVGVESLQLADNSFDFVYCGDIIEHLPHSPKSFLEDIRRVLKVGGHLLVDTKNAIDLVTRLKVLMGVSNWTPLDGFYNLPLNPHHHKEYTLKELSQALSRADFTIIHECAFENRLFRSLKKMRTWQAMAVKTVRAGNTFGTGFNPFHPFEYIRLLLIPFSLIFPGLRSDILVIGKKVR